jgi:hypothetical protein
MIKQLLENPLLYAILALFLAVYGPRLHPRLPRNVRALFNSTWFRTLIILLIVFLSSHNIQLSLIISLLFLLILMLVDASDVREYFDTCKILEDKKQKKE